MKPSNEEQDLFSLEFVKKHSGGNEKVMREFLNLFITTSEAILEETQKAIDKANYPEVARQMHKIGPGLNFLHISHLAKRVKELEQAAKTSTDGSLIRKIFGEIEPVLRSCITQLRARG